jgi:hypothetical protein
MYNNEVCVLQSTCLPYTIWLFATAQTPEVPVMFG